MNKLHIVSHRGCMWGQTGGGDLRPLFISLHFTPRSSFSYNHCTLPPMCPHNPPKNWFTQNFTRIEIGLGQFLSFRWKKSLTAGENWKELEDQRLIISFEMINKVFGSGLKFLPPRFRSRVWMKFLGNVLFSFRPAV